MKMTKRAMKKGYTLEEKRVRLWKKRRENELSEVGVRFESENREREDNFPKLLLG